MRDSVIVMGLVSGAAVGFILHPIFSDWLSPFGLAWVVPLPGFFGFFLSLPEVVHNWELSKSRRVIATCFVPSESLGWAIGVIIRIVLLLSLVA